MADRMNKIKFLSELEVPALDVSGDLIVQGESKISSLETVVTEQNIIQLRENATDGLMSNEYTGIVAKNYDGSNTGMLVFNSEGTAYVGDEGDLQPLATRDLSTEDNNTLVMWNAEKSCLVEAPMQKGAGVDSVQQKGCTASGDYSFAEGNATNATGVKSHAEGARTTASNAAAHAEGADTTASGDSSHAEGYLTTASNKYSHAEGYETTASGLYAHAEGYKTKATAMSTHAEGDTSIACGQFSHAEGSGTIAGNTSTNPGVVWNNKTLGNFTHAEGNGTRARGNSSHSEGKATNALGLASHAEGELTEASGDHSHAEGYSTIATGVKSHAEGQQTEASGIAAHAEGGANKATAQGAHAEGWNTQATASVAHSEGVSTIASGRASHAGGEGTIASAQWQTAIGKYNKEDTTALFIVGNGSSDSVRSNCFSAGTDVSGNAYAKVGNNEVATKEELIPIQQDIDNLFIETDNTKEELATKADKTNLEALLTRIAELENMLTGLMPKLTFISLYGSEDTANADKPQWEEEFDAEGNFLGRYKQIVTINNIAITPNSKIELNLTLNQIMMFSEQGITLVAENNNGVVAVYCFGEKPTNTYIIPVTITEVLITETEPIVNTEANDANGITYNIITNNYTTEENSAGGTTYNIGGSTK